MIQRLPIQITLLALMAGAAAVLFATWSRSPVHLPLPAGPHTRWLRGLPVLATAVIIGVLTTWYTDCSYLPLLTRVAVAAFMLCLILLVMHHQLLDWSGPSTLIVLVCFGWSISGTLSVSATAAMLIAKQQMEDAYRAKPLTLWRLLDGKKQKPGDVIYLTARLPAHFRAELDECHKDTAEIKLPSSIGRLKDGTYFAPDSIKEEQQVTIQAHSERHGDISATIILLPDLPTVTRKSYPTKDKQGQPAILDLIVISKSDSWVYKSDTLVEKDRLRTETTEARTRPTAVCRPILELAESHAFEPYVDVIAVGTASRKGKEIEEDGRAARRGENIARWVNAALQHRGQPKHVYFLNLGQYHRIAGESGVLTSEDTARERPVILIGVVRSGDIDLHAALSTVLEQNQKDEFFRFLVSHYPRRDIEPFKEVSSVPCLEVTDASMFTSR